MNEIHKVLREVRPRLKLVSPLTASIILGYGLINILLGLAMFAYVNPTPNAMLATITGPFTWQFWGILFIALGVFKLYALWKNEWNMMKLSLVIGVFIKFTWAIALFVRFLEGGSIILLVIWIFFAYIQAVTYINFIPGVKQRVT